ncbi:MAG: hypothetical protein R2939_00985 [Kofleriaceae bacterium]
MRASLPALAAVAVAVACGDDVTAQLDVGVPAAHEAVLREFVELTGYRAARVHAVPPGTAPAGGNQLALTVELDLTCVECYRIDAAGAGDRAWVVHAGDLLGAQYGLAHALENLGFRFRHPLDPSPPVRPAFDPAARAGLGVLHQPTQAVRGLQLHTLHPTEAYFALWEPGPTSLEEARRIFDWVIKNRGNFVQWVGLDDIIDDADRHAAWRAHTQAVIALAHARGLRVGLNIQLFGQSNLQQAFDLSDDETGTVPLADELEARLPLITDGLPFDVYDLSFGEFFNSDPERFIASVDAWAAAMRTHAPAAELHGFVHVGADQRVTYANEDLIYYMLLKFADPSIIADVHTVMFYDLYEDAGGAYHHDDFEEHRQYLLDEMRAGRVGSYVPETAYWVAFDVSVPLYLPLYVRNRWLDLDGLAADAAAEGLAPLHTHILFSTGWEWGYWLHDYAALRASYELPPAFEDGIVHAFGDDLGPAAAAEVAELARAQAATLGDARLVAYLAGRDLAIDAGDMVDIVSQPDRVGFAELADPSLRAAFVADVLPGLTAMADDLGARADRIAALGLPDTRWGRELVDGFAITALRARFAAAAYRAAVAHAEGDAAGAGASLDAARALIVEGAAIVARRHRDLHTSRPARILDRGPNATLYQYGYLRHADILCYWEREAVELERMLGRTTAAAPGCLL